MAKVRFLKPGEESKKNTKYIDLQKSNQIWKILSIIEGLALIYLIYFKS